MKKGKKDSPVSLIEDPFSIKTLEIAAAQNRDEELDLDTDLDEPGELPESVLAPDLSQLQRLADASAQETAKETSEFAATEEDGAEHSEERLARQIAEDEA